MRLIDFIFEDTNKEKKKAAGFTKTDIKRLDKEFRDDPDIQKWTSGDRLSKDIAREKQKAYGAGVGVYSGVGRDAELSYKNPNRSIKQSVTGKPIVKGGDTDPAQRSMYQYQGTDASGQQKTSPVPDQVKMSASKDMGGKVVFGRYYDSEGNYLGRTQGGQWVDAASDPNAQAQMEIVSKLEELQTRLYEYNKDSLKEAIRKIYNECGYR